MNMRIAKYSNRRGTEKKWNIKVLKRKQKKQNYEEVKTQKKRTKMRTLELCSTKNVII